MERAANAVGTAPGIDAWARATLHQLGRLPDVHRIGLALAEGGGRRLLFAASDRDNDERVDWCQIDAYQDVPLNTAVRAGDVVVGGLDDLAGRYPEFIGRQDETTTPAVAAVPLRAAGQVMGGVVLYYERPQGFGPTQRAALEQLGASLGSDLRDAQRITSHPSRSLVDEPVPPDAQAATHLVGAHPRELAAAREFLRSRLAGWGVDEDTIEAAVLCLSEFVTNAIIHTHAGCQVRVVLDHGVLTTTVRDAGSAIVRTAGDPDPLAVHGRGLQLVGALARRWGSELDDSGTTAWFVLEPGH